MVTHFDSSIGALGPHFVRALGLMSILPLGWDVLGIQSRLTVALALTIGALSQGGALHLTPQHYVWQFCIGIVIALPIAVAIELLGLVGELVDTFRGQTVMQMHEPLLNSNVSIAGLLVRQVGWVAFLVGGGAISVADLYLNVDTVQPMVDMVTFGLTLAQVLGQGLEVALRWFVPIAMVCLGVECLMIGIFKILPSFNASAEVLTIKSCLVACMLYGAVCNFNCTEIVQRTAMSSRSALQFLVSDLAPKHGASDVR